MNHSKLCAARSRADRLPAWLLVCAAALVLSTGCKKGVIVQGRVVDAQTGRPLPGATVDVAFQRLDANMNWIDGGRAQLVTGPNGEFTTRHPDMRAHFSVLGRLDGYYPNYDCKPMNTMQRRTMAFVHHIVVRLYPVVAPRPLPQGTGEVRFFPPGRRVGWNLAQGRMVDAAQADFFCELDEVGRSVAILVARGRGGFVHADWLNGEYAIYNMPEAPEKGYDQRFDLRAVGQARPCFFVQAADGIHYAKIDIIGRTKARQYMGLRFHWVYQPNGSRALEIPLNSKKKD